MLGRRYTPIQWLSLLFLGLGVACIQLAPKPGQNHEAIQIAQKFEWRLLASKPSRSQMTGLLAVVVSCFASAFAATYFEVLLKKPSIATVSEAPAAPPLQMPYGRLSVQLESNPPGKHSGQTFETLDLGARRHTVAMLSHGNHLAVPQVTKAQLPASSSPSLWIKNIQLALFSLLCTTGYNFFASSGSTAAFISSFFDGFNAFTWLVIAIQAVGGLLTALVVSSCSSRD